MDFNKVCFVVVWLKFAQFFSKKFSKMKFINMRSKCGRLRWWRQQTLIRENPLRCLLVVLKRKVTYLQGLRQSQLIKLFSSLKFKYSWQDSWSEKGYKNIFSMLLCMLRVQDTSFSSNLFYFLVFGNRPISHLYSQMNFISTSIFFF